MAELRVAGRSVFALTDAHVLDAQSEYLEDAGFETSEILDFPSGEKTKSAEHFSQALSFLAGQAANRDCAVFAFGGGVTGDLAGFVAASYLRGVDFYQIPTTLLSMVDSSVGGKTGINLPEGKNLVGAFWQPKAVFIDTALLETLPAREFAAGMAEVIKYGLLADINLLEHLEALETLNPSSPELPSIVRRCCEIKAQVVVADEKETAGSGGRALLNLGHTFGHAIENVAGYGEYLRRSCRHRHDPHQLSSPSNRFPAIHRTCYRRRREVSLPKLGSELDRARMAWRRVRKHAVENFHL